jgi:hypothetical protein
LVPDELAVDRLEDCFGVLRGDLRVLLEAKFPQNSGKDLGEIVISQLYYKPGLFSSKRMV